MNESQGRTGRGKLWFGALGGGGAWTAHLLLAYLIAEFGCEAEMDRYLWMGVTAPAWMLIAQSIVMIVISAVATLVAWRGLRRCRHPARDVRAEADVYLARTGAYASGLFTFIIIVQSIPIFFYLREC